jgi:hypothetical protein
VDVWATLRIPFVAPSDAEAPFANDASCTYPAMKRAAE